MKIVVASGKGGTGKTTVALNLAYYISIFQKKTTQLLDCDVEAPNCHLFQNLIFDQSFDVFVKKPKWNADQCTFCGVCTEVCQYNAIAMTKKQVMFFNELCHSCGACQVLCPEKAISEIPQKIGRIDLNHDLKPFAFAQGVLEVGESLAPMVIKKLKEQIQNADYNILDSSPGVTCPVVATFDQMDYCILVTEPTPFGLNDLKLAAELAQKMNLPTGIVINRSFGADEIIESFSASISVPIIGKIPFERKYAETYSNGKLLLENHPECKNIFENIFFNIISMKKSIPQVQIVKKQTSREEQTVNEAPKVTITRNKPLEITVVSGKGGTGKTTITAALSSLLNIEILSDTDVDASNLPLLYHLTSISSGPFMGSPKSYIETDLCTKCGKCLADCHFDAIHVDRLTGNYIIKESICEGCGLCRRICPSNAINHQENISGNWFLSQYDKGFLSHARLGVGEENSGRLVSIVRKNSQEKAYETKSTMIVNDGPPGVACPVIASVTGVDYVLIVTEPTLSGLHDMKRILELTTHFKIRTGLLVNKYDINLEVTNQILKFAEEHQIQVIGKISFDLLVHKAQMAQKNIVYFEKGPAYESLVIAAHKLKENLKNN